MWLDPTYVEQWQASAIEDGDKTKGKGKDREKEERKGKDKASSAKHKQPTKSHKTESSRKHGSSSGNGSGSTNREAVTGQYHQDPGTGYYFRYTEGGGVVYWDGDYGRDFYYDQNGDAQWL
jgi:hypothetical protein